MDIKTVNIAHFETGGLYSGCEGVRHVKALPWLSVVQAVEGSYDISLDGGPVESTGSMGAFIAPRACVQTITHHADPKSGLMRAQWVFLDVVINDSYRLDSLCRFPTRLPSAYNGELHGLISQLQEADSLCQKLSVLYRLVDILLKEATPRHSPDRLTEDIVSYICDHFAAPIDYRAFAAALGLSQSSLFRKFRKEFDKTPSHYINEFRILHAAALLENDTRTVREVARSVGFEDEFYFSRLFKNQMACSPTAYRERLQTEAPSAPFPGEDRT